MKVLCYTTKLVSGLSKTSNPLLAQKLAIFSSKISGARATLRLIDDIPMLKYTLEYGFGKNVSTYYIPMLYIIYLKLYQNILILRNQIVQCRLWAS